MSSIVRVQLSCLGIVTVALLATGCASTGATPRPFPTPGAGPVGAAPLPAAPGAVPEDLWATVTALVGTALELRGVPYRNGGVNPDGFDCSGFTQYVFAQHGFTLPREVRDQFRVGKPVGIEELLPGDLIFFSTVAPGPSHVAIAVGGDEFVHAPSSTGVVRVERINSTYWSPRLLGVRRMTAN
jgi:cell wall-associated NlpC family hydrolase